jgi:ADP-ribosyl-[dinitrogen reductase] hydrolase
MNSMAENKIKVSMLDKIKGSLYGVAIGDALGATVEFCSAEEINRRLGIHKEMVGGGWLNLKPGEWTDDTDMTIAVAKGILENPESPIEYIGSYFLEWFAGRPRDVGNITRAVLDAVTRGEYNWHKAAFGVHQISGKTAGNGALMRTAPVGLIYRLPKQIIKNAVDICQMTHWDPMAAINCAFYSLMIGIATLPEFCNSTNPEIDKWKIYNMAADLLLAEVITKDEELARVYSRMRLNLGRVLNNPVDISSTLNPDINPSGYTLDSLTAAEWAFISGNSLEDSIIRAVNLGGDADTIGAITGGLAGAFWGYNQIPTRWLMKFKTTQIATLNTIAEQIFKRFYEQLPEQLREGLQ